MRRHNMGSVIVGLVTVGLASGGALYAAETAGQSGATSVKIPQSAEEHLAMAASYRQKVKTYLQEVKTHQQMLEAYKQRAINNPKAPAENAWMKQMRAHCETYMAEAQQMAAEAQAFADYHELRGKELQGQ